jgi:myosin V
VPPCIRQTNSFEQLLINFANETLQQQFNRHIFKIEQDEYAEERVDWSYVDFNDNTPCLALLDNKYWAATTPPQQGQSVS